MGWMQTGTNPDFDGDWAGSGSKANFKSSLKIKDPEGKPILYDNVEEGQQSWDLVPPGSTLEWEVDTDGHSDRVALKLAYFDMDLFVTKFNLVLDGLSASQKKRFEEGDQVIVDEVTDKTMVQSGGIERLMVDLWSDIRSTGDDGKLEGEILIDPSWQKTVYFFNAHYGYEGDAESASNFSKAAWGTVEAVGWAALAVGVALALVFSGGAAAGVFFAISTGAMVIELGKFGNKLIAIGYGPATENKYGDQFPMLGFNHGYSFFVDTPQEEASTFKEWQDLLSDDNIALIDKANIAVTMIGTTKIVIGGGLLLLLIHGIKKRRG